MKLQSFLKKSISILALCMMIGALSGCTNEEKKFEEALQKEIDKRVASGELAYPEEDEIESEVSIEEQSSSDEEEKLIAYDLKGNPIEIDGQNVVEKDGEIFYKLGEVYPSGEYMAVPNEEEGHYYYAVTMEPNPDIIVTNGGSGKFSIFDTLDGEYIQYKGCSIYPIEEGPEVEKTSEGAYPEGTYKVGTQLPAGEYVVRGNKVSALITVDLSGDSDSQIGYWSSYKSAIFKVEEGQYVRAHGEDIYPLELTEDLKPTDGVYKDGMYKVGMHMPAGTYKVKPDVDTAYLEIYNDNTPGAKCEERITVEEEQNFTVKDGQYIIIIGGRASLT